MVWAGPLAIAALLAALAGVAKLRSPSTASEALKAVGLPSSGPLVRVGALLETAVAVAALVSGNRLTMAVLAGTYVAFAGFVVVARRRPAVASCGCFGEVDSTPSWRHVAIDVLLAIGAGGAALAGTPGLGSVIQHQPAFAVPFVAVVLAASWLAYLLLSASTDRVAEALTA